MAGIRYMVHYPAMKDHAPPMNAIMAEIGEQPEYPENADARRYLVLYPSDYQEHGVDMAGNVALLLDEQNAREVKRLAEEIIADLEG
jgi:hypothetical protein